MATITEDMIRRLSDRALSKQGQEDTNPETAPEMDPKEVKQIRAKAQRLISGGVWRAIRKEFPRKNWSWFRFYRDLMGYSLGLPLPEMPLDALFKRQTNILIQGGLSPATVNQIASARVFLMGKLRDIQKDPSQTAAYKRIVDVLVPILANVAKDRGIYIKLQPQPLNGVKWVSLWRMRGSEKKLEVLKDEDPRTYQLVMKKKQTLREIDENIQRKIEQSGKIFKKGVIGFGPKKRIPVSIGEDPITGEQLIYDRDGDVLTRDEFLGKLRRRSEEKEALARFGSRTQIGEGPRDFIPEDQRTVSKDEIDWLVSQGGVEFVSLTDDKAKQSRDTRIFPVARKGVFVTHADGTVSQERYQVITGGRYKGFYLDDMVNAHGRLIEGAAYRYQPKRGKTSTVPERVDPSQREPYVTVADVETVRTFRGKKVKQSHKKLFLKIGGARSMAELRNALKKLSCNHTTSGVKGCIESVVWEKVEGSQAAAFYFDPKDFGVVMESLQGMTLSEGATNFLKDYYEDLSRAEQATNEKNLANYSMDTLPGFKAPHNRLTNPATGGPAELNTAQKKALAWLDANGNQGVCALETGVGKCVREDTLILTDKGLTPIQDINPGITEPDTTAPVEGWSVLVGGEKLPVRNFYYGGPKPTIKVRTHRGFEVEGSLIHPLLVRTPEGKETWVKTPELEAGDYLCVEREEADFPVENPVLSVPKPEDFQNGTRNPESTYTNANVSLFDVPDRMSPDMGRLLGYIVAEGWTNNRKVFSISQDPEKNPRVRADIEELLQRLLGWEAKPEKDIYVSSVFLREYLLRMGVGYGLSKDKAVPGVVLRSPKETVRQFLRGIIDAEGYVDSRGYIEFSTASEQMGREIQILLLRFGIVSSRRPKKVRGYDHTYWRLTITGQDAEAYGSKIGFVSERKQDALGNISKAHNNNLDTVPHLAPEVGNLFGAVLKSLDMNVSAFRRRMGSASFDTTVNHIRLGRRNPTYPFLRELLSLAADAGCQEHPSFKTIGDVLERHLFYDPIEGLEDSEAVVMDIEVDDPSHCFVGNGLVNHNTLTAIATMQKFVRDGLADEGASFTRPDGRVVTTNGRFLFVCPKDLRGNVRKEIDNFLAGDAARVLKDRLDVIAYREFSGKSNSGRVPVSLAKSPFWKDLADAQKAAVDKDKEDRKRLQNIDQGKVAAVQAKTPRQLGIESWEPEQYVSVFFDEAHLMMSRKVERGLQRYKSSAAQAALNLYHPHKVCLTASPLEKSPMDSYFLAAVSSNKPLNTKSIEGRDNMREMRRFKQRFCETLGGRIVGVQNDPRVRRDLETWVKRNVYHADKNGPEFKLPQLNAETEVVEMSPLVQSVYKGMTKEFRNVMRALVLKFRDLGRPPDRMVLDEATGEITRIPAKATKQQERDMAAAEELFRRKFQPVMQMLTDLSNKPEAALENLALMIETGKLRNGKPLGELVEQHPELGGFLKFIKAMAKRFSPDQLRELASKAGVPKIDRAAEIITEKASQTEGSRTLLFSDDEDMCMRSGVKLSQEQPGFHVVALKKGIHIFRGGKELDQIRVRIPRKVFKDLYPNNEEARARAMNETDGFAVFDLPLSEKQYKPYPGLRTNEKKGNPRYKASDWQQFAFKEIINPRAKYKTASLYGPSYGVGQNLQAFDTVIHLDRDSWNSENMKQRTARAWRQGQESPVDEITIDAVYRSTDNGKPVHGDMDKTLDEIRSYFQQVEGSLFDAVIRQSQGRELGKEWLGMNKQQASLSRISPEVLELELSPFANRSQPPNRS